VDGLYGLKENVIIGKLIPAGTGYRREKGLAARAASHSPLMSSGFGTGSD
jgi:hypothetical protein